MLKKYEIKEIKNNLSKNLKKKKIKHCLRVRKIAIKIAEKLKFDNDQTLIIEIAALLHDIKKESECKQVLDHDGENIFPTHGELGSDYIKEPKKMHEILKRIFKNHDENIDKKKSIITVATIVKYHCGEISYEYDDNNILLIECVRAADKIDKANKKHPEKINEIEKRLGELKNDKVKKVATLLLREIKKTKKTKKL